MKLLEVSNLKKSYGNKEVIKGVSFEINKGEIFGLLGANGAGKTTTLECIEGIKSFNSGKISIMGEDIKGNSRLHKILGVQLQNSSLQKNITVKEAMKFHCVWHDISYRGDLMDKFGISILEDKQYRMLSVGQKRRLHLALALAHDPEILILDEPTAGLDVEGRNDLHKEIQVLNAEGLTVILASHDMAEVESLCHKVGVMVEGEMKFYGSKEDFVNTKGDTKYIKLKTDQDEIFKDYRSTSYEFINQSNEGMLLKTLNILETMVEISDYALKKNIHINSISTDSLSIEERFMDLITNKRKEKNEKVIL